MTVRICKVTFKEENGNRYLDLDDDGKRIDVTHGDPVTIVWYLDWSAMKQSATRAYFNPSDGTTPDLGFQWIDPPEADLFSPPKLAMPLNEVMTMHDRATTQNAEYGYRLSASLINLQGEVVVYKTGESRGRTMNNPTIKNS